MGAATNRRHDGRLYAHYECAVAGYRQKARGRIGDISHHGALILETAAIPIRGELVGLHFDGEAGPVLLIGWVVRHVQRGFAIEFDHLSDSAKRFIDDLAGVVEAERRKIRHPIGEGSESRSRRRA